MMTEIATSLAYSLSSIYMWVGRFGSIEIMAMSKFELTKELGFLFVNPIAFVKLSRPISCNL